MALTDGSELKRLILQIERDLLAQADLRVLLKQADAKIKARRTELRAVQSRLERTRRSHERRAQRSCSVSTRHILS